jgi:OPT family oligopeptide transporter
MAGSASATPEAMTVLAVQKLWYDINPTPFIGLSLILSAQMLGYGVAGILRKTLVYPTKMLYPAQLPVATLLETLHKDKETSAARMKYFYVSFAILFCWQAFPSYIMPLLGGISLFCLTNRTSLFATNLFGGSMANEGLGVLSISLDWQMIGGGKNPLWVPLQTLINEFIGYFISIFLYMGIYYGGMWEARRFPFLSPMLFDDKSTSKKYVPFDVKRILNEDKVVDPKLVAEVGLPWFSASHASALVTLNVAIAGTIAHMLLWHYDDLSSAWAFLAPKNIKALGSPMKWNWKFWQGEARKLTQEEAEAIDPHYALMQAYEEVPNWWYGLVWGISVTLGMVAIHVGKTTLPWWGMLVAILLSHVSLVFFAALTAMFGYSLMVQPFIQMIGAYLIPGKPIANMYFATYGFNSLYQAKHMLRDLKLGQYAHLAPRCTFTVQVIGTIIGCCVSYIMMEKITDEKRDILMAIQGTNVWSGQMLQAQNAAAISWGGLAKYMYSTGGKYWQVPIGFLVGIAVPFPFWLGHKFFPKLKLDYFNTAIICAALGILSHGTHSAYLMYYAIGFLAQFYLRNYKPVSHDSNDHSMKFIQLMQSAGMVRQVQLHSQRRYGWRRQRHQLHPHLHRLRRRGQDRGVSGLLRKQPS